MPLTNIPTATLSHDDNDELELEQHNHELSYVADSSVTRMPDLEQGGRVSSHHNDSPSNVGASASSVNGDEDDMEDIPVIEATDVIRIPNNDCKSNDHGVKFGTDDHVVIATAVIMDMKMTENQNDSSTLPVDAVDLDPIISSTVDYNVPELEDPKSPYILGAQVYRRKRDSIGIQIDDGSDEEQSSTNKNKRISFIAHDGIFAKTPIQVGHEILSINNKSCRSWSASEILHRLNSIDNGYINIVVRDPQGDPSYVQAMVLKRKKEDFIGIGLVTKHHKLRIQTIEPSGALANSVLNIGDYVQAINSVRCSNFAPQAAADLIQNSIAVTILTRTGLAKGVVLAEDGSYRGGSSIHHHRRHRHGDDSDEFTQATAEAIPATRIRGHTDLHIGGLYYGGSLVEANEEESRSRYASIFVFLIMAVVIVGMALPKRNTGS